ncbi:MAG: hypothetical protein LBJ62_10960 [Bifidobacteriaceae bacterium]|jgi:hypothetical protein|nr:hypothetical protein [Bifidobacteriaceae bacterium]
MRHLLASIGLTAVAGIVLAGCTGQNEARPDTTGATSSPAVDYGPGREVLAAPDGQVLRLELPAISDESFDHSRTDSWRCDDGQSLVIGLDQASLQVRLPEELVELSDSDSFNLTLRNVWLNPSEVLDYAAANGADNGVAVFDLEAEWVEKANQIEEYQTGQESFGDFRLSTRTSDGPFGAAELTVECVFQFGSGGELVDLGDLKRSGADTFWQVFASPRFGVRVGQTVELVLPGDLVWDPDGLTLTLSQAPAAEPDSTIFFDPPGADSDSPRFSVAGASLSVPIPDDLPDNSQWTLSFESAAGAAGTALAGSADLTIRP